MSLFINLLQVFGWVATGYYIRSSNLWAVLACVLFALFMGIVNAMNMVSQELNNGSSNKS